MGTNYLKTIRAEHTSIIFKSFLIQRVHNIVHIIFNLLIEY